jgi:dTDP-4-amino-4,6-dideoxygalactose transaminase
VSGLTFIVFPANSLSDDEIPVLRPLMPSADQLLPYLRRIDATRIYTNHGPLVQEFEKRIAGTLSVPTGGVASASSGSAALAAAIMAVAGRATAERPLALIPAFTFVATATVAEQLGYEPYLCDVDPETWMLDPARLADHPMLEQLGVVIPVAPFGRPVPQAPWRAFQAAAGIPVVIDGAACFGEILDDPERFLGAIPVAISFHATKGFSTGEGGAVVATDADLIIRAVRALNFGCYGSREAQSWGGNGKMSEYHAAVGLAELDGWTDKRSSFLAVADDYRRVAAAYGVAARLFVTPDVGMPYALFRCADAAEADHVRQALGKAHIGWRFWYGGGLLKHPHLSGARCDDLGTTSVLAPTLIGLPMAPDLSHARVSHVIGVLADALRSSAAAGEKSPNASA